VNVWRVVIISVATLGAIVAFASVVVGHTGLALSFVLYATLLGTLSILGRGRFTAAAGQTFDHEKATSEVYFDPVTGEEMRVYSDPSTGIREYRSLGR
jgi:hypothetical protein